MLRRLALCALIAGPPALFVACAATNGGGSDFGVGGAGGYDDDSSSTTSGPSGPSGPTAQSSTTTGDFIDGGLSGSGGAGGGGIPDCSEAAKLIYVVGTGYELYSYEPPTKQFKQVGILNCPAGGFATPFSMAVDRQAIAWVLYNDGTIWHVDINNGAKCTPSNYFPNQAGFSTFGMGFVANMPGSTEETIYIGNYTGADLGLIDPMTLAAKHVGNYNGGNGLSGAAEITGTGDARLYGFFATSDFGATVVAEIDKSTAAIKSYVALPQVTIGSGWAFAFWGGAFYLFTAPSGSSQVTKLTLDPMNPNSGTTTVEVPSVGFVIVGAGVSTCAPVEPPK
jgi:hypothetical protein